MHDDLLLLFTHTLSFVHALLICMLATTHSTKRQLKVMEMRMMRVISITVEVSSKMKLMFLYTGKAKKLFFHWWWLGKEVGGIPVRVGPCPTSW